MAEEDKNIRECAASAGVAYSTFHGWVTGTVDRIPVEGMSLIARMTGLPVEYWQNPAAPYPPPVEYTAQTDAVLDLVKALGADDLSWIVSVLRDDGRRRRVRALERAADGYRRDAADSRRAPGPQQ